MSVCSEDQNDFVLKISYLALQKWNFNFNKTFVRQQVRGKILLSHGYT